MARFNPHHDLSKVYALTERWVRDCLIADKSLFSERSLWNSALLNQLIDAFVRKPVYTPDMSFLEKLEQQLAHCAPEGKQLMAELLYILTIFQTNMRPVTKRELVRTVWGWSGITLPADHPYLEDGILEGIGSPGTAYQTHRWRELAYFIQVIATFKSEPRERREALASNPDDFAKWVDAIETEGYRQFRNILVHLAFPDAFERITVDWHKRQILQAFSSLPEDKLKTARDYDLDLALRDLRKKLTAELGTADVDFYDEALRPRWQSKPAEKAPSSRAWLLSWNPSRWNWTTLPQARLSTVRGSTVTESWSCHNRHVTPGDRVFLARAGEEPRGIVARGTALSAPYETKHYDPARAAAGEKQFSIDIQFDDIRDPHQDPFLPMADLEKLSSQQHWTPQQSGIEIRSETVPLLEETWAKLPKPKLEEPVPATPVELAQEYTVDDIFAEGCFLSPSEVQAILNTWQTKKNLVLQGPPGTGKTWLAKRLAYALIGYKEERRIVSVQFHPNLSYEDFVRGWRPRGDGKLELVDGVFLEAIKAAMTKPGVPYVVLIEEINRGNPAQIFGELLTLIEDSKRNNGDAMRLAYPRHEQERVYVPDNLFVLGTMNIADRSLALVDLALRRRFAFVDLDPQFNERWERWLIDRFGIDQSIVNEIRGRLETLNQQIAADDRLGPQFRVGHSYVTPPAGGAVEDARAWFRQIVTSQIAPLLREYWFDDKSDTPKKACEGLVKDW